MWWHVLGTLPSVDGDGDADGLPAVHRSWLRSRRAGFPPARSREKVRVPGAPLGVFPNDRIASHSERDEEEVREGVDGGRLSGHNRTDQNRTEQSTHSRRIVVPIAAGLGPAVLYYDPDARRSRPCIMLSGFRLSLPSLCASASTYVPLSFSPSRLSFFVPYLLCSLIRPPSPLPVPLVT